MKWIHWIKQKTLSWALEVQEETSPVRASLPESTGVKMLAKSGRNFQSLEAH